MCALWAPRVPTTTAQRSHAMRTAAQTSAPPRQAHTSTHTALIHTLVTRASATTVLLLKNMSVCSSAEARPAIWALRWRLLRLSEQALSESLGGALAYLLVNI